MENSNYPSGKKSNLGRRRFIKDYSRKEYTSNNKMIITVEIKISLTNLKCRYELN